MPNVKLSFSGILNKTLAIIIFLLFYNLNEFAMQTCVPWEKSGFQKRNISCYDPGSNKWQPFKFNTPVYIILHLNNKNVTHIWNVNTDSWYLSCIY